MTVKEVVKSVISVRSVGFLELKSIKFEVQNQQIVEFFFVKHKIYIVIQQNNKVTNE